MLSNVQVGTILMKECPGMTQVMGFETEPGFGDWSTVSVPEIHS